MTMLTELSTSEFQTRYGCVTNLGALYRLLQTSREVVKVATAFREKRLKRVDIENFVRDILTHYVVGQHFQYNVTLAALIVALEKSRESFANQFVSYLAGLCFAELQVATGIAKLVLKSQSLDSQTQRLTIYLMQSDFRRVDLHDMFVDADDKHVLQVVG